MKVCFIGAGSIGKRHIKNFKKVCNENGTDLEIHALRSGISRLPEDIEILISRQCTDISLLDNSYDVIFITNPTHLHYETIEKLKHHSIKFYVEKPLFHSLKLSIESLNLPKENVYYVACPLRYTQVLAEAKKKIAEEKVYSARSISSSYLPDWRPNVDYRKIYSSHKEQGGGVQIDLIHEWDYLISFFGFPKEIDMASGKFSHLEIDSDDLATYIAKYDDKIVEVHLDYFGRKTQRYLELYTRNGLWCYDIANTKVFYNGEIIYNFSEDINDKYVREMEHFFDIVTGKRESTNTLYNAIKVQMITEGFKI